MKLKSAIALCLAMPVIAFGGTCYEATTTVPANIPSVFCLDSIQDSTTSANTLNVVSADQSFPATLKITSTSRHTEDRLRFEASTNLVSENEQTCGNSFEANLIVKGEFLYGEISPSYLTLSVETESYRDTCHSYPVNETINYTLVK